jgi:phenylphosphate carboxylase alpha subunit
MAYYDLREFMDACDQAGEMTTIEKEIDWNLEAGAISRRICEIGAPMAHMKNVKGYPEGFSMLGSPLSKGWNADFSRIAVALGMDPHTSFDSLMDQFIQRMKNPIRPMQVKTGPCKENILTGKDINLFNFPAPYLHEGDGGRYIDTFGVTCQKDPDSDWVNWGVYRHMIHKKAILGGIVNPFQHNGMIYYQKYEARGNDMPFSIYFGGCPSGSIVGSMNIPAGVSEADIAGGLRREPMHLVKCETNDLLVPATAEIVIEGHVRPHERWDEGPFGEATGYRASPRMPRPVFRVDCITHRDNPIMPISCAGTDLDECEILFGVFSLTSGMERELREAGLPVRGVFSPPGLKFALLLVSVEKGHAGIADKVVSALRASKMGVFFQYVAIVEDEVEVTDIPQVLHTVFTRTHPVRGLHVRELAPGHPLIPFLDLHDKMHARGSTMCLDATTPTDWDNNSDTQDRISFENSYPETLRQKVQDNWQDYGLAPESKHKNKQVSKSKEERIEV